MIEALYRSILGVYSALYTKETQSVLIHHDPSISAEQLAHVVYPKEMSKQERETNFKQELTMSIAAMFIDFVFPAKGLLGFKQLLRPGAIAALIASRGMIVNGTKGLIQTKKPNADTLSTTAIFASILKGSPRSALVILFMSTLSEIITEITANKTRNYVRDMMKLDVSYVWRVDSNGEEKKVSIKEVQKGDYIAVFEGDKISVDGTVVRGWANVDESCMTGEYMPKDVSFNQKVYAGTIVKSGNLCIKVENVGDQTAVSRIVSLIEGTQEKKAPIQSYADQLSERLVPLSFLLAGFIYIVTKRWDRVLNMLVIDFVCGIKLSTATAISASIGKAARGGALIKGGEYLEKLSKIDTAILDKTGTITIGKPVVKQVIPFNGFTEREILKYVASAEEHSSHPIAEAIVKLAKEWRLELPEHDHDHMEQIVGHGVKAKVADRTVLIGNKKLLLDEKVQARGLKFIDKLAVKGNTVYVALDGKVAGVIVLEDTIRDGMKRTINQLRHEGIDEVVMITGDKEDVAKDVYQQLHLDAYHAEVLPQHKLEYVQSYKALGNTVMMVGDGINDAPALTYADVGVTMGGKRTDIAVEVSDVVITSDNPIIITDVIKLSKSTMNTVKQNFIITIAVNSAAIILGAFGTIAPIISAAIHNAATIGVVLNSMKILFKEERIKWNNPSPPLSTTYLVDSA
ncbi:cadmium-translocating P-type ATPase [Bacillus sp. B15-48]|nr:cadmium-translocating P-type ATPase [Bacillus sp. B15-48]